MKLASHIDKLTKLIRKDITRDDFAGGGLMNPKQRDRFIEFMQQGTPLFDRARIETMASTSEEIDGLLFEDRLTRGVGINSNATLGLRDTEDQEAFARGIGSYKIHLNAQELSLFYKIPENVLQDNIEGQNLEGTVIKSFANVFSKDLEDLCINGDVVDRVPSAPISTTVNGAHTAVITTLDVADASAFPTKSHPSLIEFPGYLKAVKAGVAEYMTYTGKTGNQFTGVTRGATILDTGTTSAGQSYVGGETVTWVKHHLLGVTDGWLYKLTHPGSEPGAIVVNGAAINGGVINTTHFFAALDAMPEKYLDLFGVTPLAWIVNQKTKIKILQMISQRDKGGGVLADSIIQGKDWDPLSIPFIACNKFPKDKILLTNPENLTVGIWKDITFRSTNQGKSAISTNQRYYNIRGRADAQVERKDYAVIIDGISTTAWV